MADSADPTIQRLALGRRLRRIRLAADLSHRQAAASLQWSFSKLLKVESGESSIDATDLGALLTVCGFSDPIETGRLVRLARDGRQAVVAQFDDVLSNEVRLLLRCEGAASVISQFESLVIPGLLQTREYAEAILRLFAEPGDSPTAVARRVEARLSRQVILDRGSGPDMHFILDESVLRRWVGAESADTPVVLRRQLQHLREVAENPRVTIRILPSRSGAHPGLKGPFVIMEFADPALGDLLYLEDVKGDHIAREEPAELRPYLERFAVLESLAIPEADLDRFLGGLLSDLP